jgi:hypothetical protein
VNTGYLDSADPYLFPSGHTAGAFAIATMLTLRYSKNPEVYIPTFIGQGWSVMEGSILGSTIHPMSSVERSSEREVLFLSANIKTNFSR